MWAPKDKKNYLMLYMMTVMIKMLQNTLHFLPFILVHMERIRQYNYKKTMAEVRITVK